MGVWTLGDWTTCTVSCGSGTQTRTVECVIDSSIDSTGNSCNDTKPSSQQVCNTVKCVDLASIGYDWPVNISFSLSSSPPWPGRSNFGAVNYMNHELYIIAGGNTTTTFNDVWYSSFDDGLTTWIRVATPANFTARTLFASIVWDNAIIIAGGLLVTQELSNVVYIYEPSITIAQSIHTHHTTALTSTLQSLMETDTVEKHELSPLKRMSLTSAGIPSSPGWSSTTAAFSPRMATAVANFESDLYFAGGIGHENVTYNDVWKWNADGSNSIRLSQLYCIVEVDPPFMIVLGFSIQQLDLFNVQLTFPSPAYC